MGKINKILVLGATGMLGSMIYNYFSKINNYKVVGTYRNDKDKKTFANQTNIFHFDANNNIETQLNIIYSKFQFDYVINCIGIINIYCRDNDSKGVLNAIKINALFPHNLSESSNNINANIKIIQIATDCVYSGILGDYDENSKHDAIDVYGKTKSLGEVNEDNILNIRCSIIGHEHKGKTSLLEWFLSNPNKAQLNGFSHHEWNGVTTLQFAQFCEAIIDKNKFKEYRNNNHVIHYIPNESVNKYELLNIFQEVYKTEFIITDVNNIGKPVKRTLSSCYYKKTNLSMRDVIIELKDYSNSFNIS